MLLFALPFADRTPVVLWHGLARCGTTHRVRLHDGGGQLMKSGQELSCRVVGLMPRIRSDGGVVRRRAELCSVECAGPGAPGSGDRGRCRAAWCPDCAGDDVGVSRGGHVLHPYYPGAQVQLADNAAVQVVSDLVDKDPLPGPKVDDALPVAKGDTGPDRMPTLTVR